MAEQMGLGIIGCGNIANAYARALAAADAVTIAGYADLEPARAQALADAYGGRVYAGLEEMLADETVELVVNLTIHQAHYEVTRRCLEAGRHVYSEKPLALTTAEAKALVALARAQGVRLASAPSNHLGEAQQTAWKLVREGRLGTVRVAYAEVDWGRIEIWHPAPQPFYEVGPLFDVGVYPLTLLTAMFGPANRVSAYETVLLPERVTKEGQPYHLHAPNFHVVMVEFASGPVARLTANFYVSQKTQAAGIAFHGDEASLALGHWFLPDASVGVAPWGEGYEPVSLVQETPPGFRWERGVLDLVQAIRDGRPARVTGEQAAHVVEILCAARESAESGGAVPVVSTFVAPEPVW
jgi:predicted dehydrogenase